jgi:hypothetical protein
MKQKRFAACLMAIALLGASFTASAYIVYLKDGSALWCISVSGNKPGDHNTTDQIVCTLMDPGTYPPPPGDLD